MSIATVETRQAKPFLKWAGGKSQLLSQFEDFYPTELKQGKVEKYIEPFVGGGSVFLAVAQKYKMSSAYLSDVNPEIILAYKVIQKYPHELIERLQKISRNYQDLPEEKKQEFYYKIRQDYNLQKSQIDFQHYSLAWISRVAMLIFLNRTCFNGLFRLNNKGLFNVPHGRYKNPRILDEENLMAVSQLLEVAEIKLGDFERCEEAITSNSFIYFDPPYRPLSKTSSFTSYSTFNFDDSQQIRLANFLRHLDGKHNIKMMLSNSDPKNTNPQDNFFEDLYQGFNIYRVSASRMINSKAEGRGKIDELVITNY